MFFRSGFYSYALPSRLKDFFVCKIPLSVNSCVGNDLLRLSVLVCLSVCVGDLVPRTLPEAVLV